MPVPDRPRRIRVVGVSGSGKSRLAAEISRRTGLPRLELDAVFWDADWTYRDLEEAQGIVRDFMSKHPEGWVIDGNWTSRLEGLLDHGSATAPDVFVWIDHPRSVVMSRIVRRTLRRGILREELWHGNRERPASWVKRDPAENIVRWAWVQHPVVRARMAAHAEEGWPIVRLEGQRAADAWLGALGSPPSGDEP